MKLRLRSFETKETLKIEVPNHCTLQHLEELVSQKLASPSRSPAIHFSLNRKDNLTTTSPEETIQSIGITSGDLIHFTTNANGFSTAPQIPSVATSQPKPEQSQNPQTLNTIYSKHDEMLTTKSKETHDFGSEKGKTIDLGNPTSGPSETPTSNTEKGKTIDISNPDSEEVSESMEIDDDGSFVTEAGKSFSVPNFLRKVFTEELGDDDGLNHKLLGIAVRAVLLESGFVEIDPISRLLKSNNNFDVPGNWHFASFHYTLPSLINSGNLEVVKIKFQSLGKYCTVYGSLVNGTGSHSVLLDEDKLVPFLNVVWANCGQVVETIEENNKVFNVEPEKEVFEFWKKMKDGLVLPLLIDICEKAGFELPPCFMRLPTELKLKILESASGVDIATVSCVCSELRYLASSDDLWKQKYIEQFGSVGGSESGRTYKERFAKAWESKKRRKIAGRSNFDIMRRRYPYAPIGSGPLGIGRFPGIIGGDYDLFPNVGPFGAPGPVRLPGGGGLRLRNVMPNCDLGGSDM